MQGVNSKVKLLKFLVKYVYAFFGCLGLFLGGVLLRQNRDLISSLAIHFGYGKRKSISIPALLPKIELAELIRNNQPVKMLEFFCRKGNVSLTELWVINQLIKQFDPKAVFEFGTFDGRTTLNMAANSCENAIVYTIDLPKESMNATKLLLCDHEKCLVDKQSSGEKYRKYLESKKIVQLYGDTATFNFDPYFNQMEFVFVDASHAYDYVMNDTRLALKLLKQGKGVILWHDYDAAFEGVTRALNELLAKELSSLKNMRHIENTSLAIMINF